MSAILFRENGKKSVVKIAKKTINGAKKFYSKQACTNSEVDITDISMRQLENGDLEYISCIYDAAGGTGGKMMAGKTNTNFSFGPVFGCVMFIKSISKTGTSSNFMDDKVVNLGMDSESILELCVSFYGDVWRFFGGHFPNVSHGTIRNVPPMFPYIRGTVLGSRIVFSIVGVPSTPSMEIDLLSHKAKFRSFTIGIIYGILDGNENIRIYNKLLDKMENAMTKAHVCYSCKKITTISCSRCKNYYCCGESECVSSAWEMHKKECK